MENDESASSNSADAEPAPAENSDFAAENKTNMWDSIRSSDNDTEDDLDVPPSLRAKLRGK